MTAEEFEPIWASLRDAWPTAKVRRGSMQLYLRRLAVFTIDEVRAAADEAICTGDFFPSVGALWQRCVAIRDAAPGWEAAWVEATTAVAAWQPGATVHRPWAYSHPAVREAVRVVGAWVLKTSEHTPALRAQFRDAYLAILARRRRDYATGRRALPLPQPSQRLNPAWPRPAAPTLGHDPRANIPQRPGPLGS